MKPDFVGKKSESLACSSKTEESSMSLLNFKLTEKFSIIAFLQIAAIHPSYGQQSCKSPPEAANSFARTEPFSVLYSKGRTYRNAYEKDPNTLGNSKPQKDFLNVCWKFKDFDFSTKGVGNGQCSLNLRIA
jgi:hypothetical protein